MAHPSKISLKFHSAGTPFIALFAVATVLFGLVGLPFFFVGVILTAWCAYFFRDPDRITPTRSGLIISPADGKVVSISEVTPEADLGLDNALYTRISIFLNVFDVHVNRIPVDGKVTAANYRKGKFVNASLDKASIDNERMALAVEMTGTHPYAGQKLGVVQIAGLIARRIICTAHESQTFKAGAHYGIIRFGSRADIYLPKGITPLVIIGQYMIGGETVLADAASNELQRTGECR